MRRGSGIVMVQIFSRRVQSRTRGFDAPQPAPVEWVTSLAACLHRRSEP